MADSENNLNMDVDPNAENNPENTANNPNEPHNPTLALDNTNNGQNNVQNGSTAPVLDENREVIVQYVKKVREHMELQAKLKHLRSELAELNAKDSKLETDLKSLQSIGQIVGYILRQIDDGKYIVKASSGPRYVVCCRANLDKSFLKVGTRVSLDMTTLTIMKYLNKEIDPIVFNMLYHESDREKEKEKKAEEGKKAKGGEDEELNGKDEGKEEEKEEENSYKNIGGLKKQINEMREIIELPLKNPYLFKRIGIKPPKGVLLYGPPGTGKTLLARTLANDINCNFLKIVASSIVDKYIGESSKIIREMFGYAKNNEPCIIFIDEIDAIGGKRFSQGTSADREIQRTLMELLIHLDGFDELGQIKIIMATNRPDVLDPALLRPGRIDRKIEIPLPNQASRIEILRIHSKPLNIKGDINYNNVCKLCDGFNGADLRNICTEAGINAIRNMRDYVVEEDFFKAARKLTENKKLESALVYDY